MLEIDRHPSTHIVGRAWLEADRTLVYAIEGVARLNRWASLLGTHHRLARVCGWRFSAEACR